MAKNCPKTCSGSRNDQYSLMEYQLVGFFHTLTVLVVDIDCIPTRFNVDGLLRPWKIGVLALKQSSECGLARDFGQYFGIIGSVLAQQFYSTARRCFWSIVVGVGKGLIERAANSLCLEPLCPASIWHRNRDRLGEVMLHFGSALVARGVLTDADLGKLVLQYLKRSEQLKHQWRSDVGVPVVDNVVKFWLWLPIWNKFPVLHKVVQMMLV